MTITIVIKLADTGERRTYHCDGDAPEIHNDLTLARDAVIHLYGNRPIKRCLACATYR